MYEHQNFHQKLVNSIVNPSTVVLPPDTVRSLLECAHTQMGILEDETAGLGKVLHPVRAVTPTEAMPGEGSNYGADPECISVLRTLIDRIVAQQQVVRALASEVRI